MLVKLKNRLNNTLTSMNLTHKTSRGIDYKTLSHHILNINQLWDINSIINEVSRSIKEIVDYELFGFAIEDDKSLDIWIDPISYNISFADFIQGHFHCQDGECKIHYFDNGNGEISHNFDDINTDDLLSYNVLDNTFNAKLFILPKKKMFYYQYEMMQIMVKNISIAIAKSLNIKKLENEVFIDPLTNCYNRRALSSYIEHNIACAKRYGSDLSVIMFDIDYFKTINDSYGHHVGDHVLREVSNVVHLAVRKSDYLVRYGGDEFVLVLPNTKFSYALELAERLRSKKEKHMIDFASHQINITASFGVASLENDTNLNMLLQEADKMLYKAKEHGKNTVMPHSNLNDASLCFLP